MKPLRFVVPMALLFACAAAAQQLDCPGSSSRSSDTFHYHVSMYRPDTRGFFDAWGINQFSSQSACDRAREAHMKRNLAVVDYFKRERGQTQYEPDRFGTCHPDLSTDKTNPRFLNDVQRLAQIRTAEEIRQRVRERLMDSGVATDAEIFKSVAPPPSSPPALLGGPKLPPMPAAGAASQETYAASDLRSTRAVESTKPAMANLDLPLVDAAPGAAVPADLTTSTSTAAPAPQAPAAPAAVAVQPAPDAKPAEPVTQTAETPAPPAAHAPEPAAATTADASSAEDVADTFIAYETQRIQNVLKASGVIADGAVKAKIYESCMQRIQLLSNLRALIEGSGAKSRLATTARTARSEDERLTFVSRLFGDDIRKHWAPADATDVILEAQPDVENDVERVLRDSTGKYTDQQKRRALYTLLARSQPTEDQQLWLTTIADTFLQ